MGLVDHANKVNVLRRPAQGGRPGRQGVPEFAPRDYLDYIAEHVEPWSYMKFCFLKDVGWKGFAEGAESGVYCVAPLARLNAARGWPRRSHRRRTRSYCHTLGGKPVHHTLVNHWARIIELSTRRSGCPSSLPTPRSSAPRSARSRPRRREEGIGVVEAPRGTLIHHYQTDERGIITGANLIVATQNNAARIAMSVERRPGC